MLSDAVRLIHCPRCQGSEVHLVRPPTAWDSVLLPEPTLCHSCASILRKRMVFAQLATRIALDSQSAKCRPRDDRHRANPCSGPVQVAFTPNGEAAYVLNELSNNVCVINTAELLSDTWKRAERIFG